MLFRFLTEHCEIKLPTMALYILWYHASVLVCCCCCCCCFIQLSFFFAAAAPPGSRGPSPARDLPPDPRAGRGPGGRGAARARATGAAPLARNSHFPFLSPLIGVKLPFPFSSFIGVKPPYLFFWVKLHIIAFYFIYTKHEIDQVKCSIYIYISLRENSPH